jgi:hypothetical protein
MEQSTGDSQQDVSRYLVDFEKANGGEKPEEGKEEQEELGINDDLVDSQSPEESGEPRFATKAPSIDMHLRDFLPGNQKESSMKMDVCECYCAASLWNSSGLLPEPKSREKIARRLGLRKDEPARVGKAFEELLHLQKPWMQGRSKPCNWRCWAGSSFQCSNVAVIHSEEGEKGSQRSVGRVQVAF